ncbi:hypothetical protein ALP90_102249 [Pseudomonas amygdali pv. ulmi]|uniref:Resolvase HTH domain-containing protein n=1 Tax=Pseudomonas amygdali pv. ulmi TaxID=251720 RepID=A0A3M4SW72_PSEA0|nr:hypothetical protein ALP90_102249 [Pseudomonas amygdali pv. ulmi]
MFGVNPHQYWLPAHDGNFWDSGLQPHDRVIALKSGGCSIAETARLAGVSVSQVKRVWAQSQAKVKIGYLGEGEPKTASQYVGDY